MLDKSLGIALLISTIFHTAVFLPLAHLQGTAKQKVLPALKVTYLAPQKDSPQKIQTERKPAKLVAPIKKSDVKGELKLTPDNTKKLLAQQCAKIEIPPELPKEKEALYLSYYQSIREKIRTFVVYNYPQFIACGEVYLYFVLLSDGKLQEIKIVEGKSSQNQLLKKVAERSINQAAPFLPFPAELSQERLSFNVVVSFEVEN